jgi:hypothetical protein
MNALRLDGGKGTFPRSSLPSRSDGGCHPQGRSAAKEAHSALTPVGAEATPAVPSGDDLLRSNQPAPSRSRWASTGSSPNP